MSRRNEFERALEAHGAAVTMTVTRAESLADDAWNVPVAEGKWSPGEILAHLASSYRIVTDELRGGEGMKIRVPLIRRWVLRLTILPRILAGGGFPRGAVAPRETRPGDVLDKPAAVALFSTLAEEFEEAARSAPAGARITHAYFGAGSVADGVLLCARHVEHHASQLPSDV